MANSGSGEPLLSIRGRLNRQPFIGAMICIWFATAILDAGAGWLFGDGSDLHMAAGLVVILAATWPVIVLQIKRFHDIGLSGWTTALLLVPVINLLPLGMCIFMRGTAGDNRYGPDPLAVETPAGGPGPADQAAA